MDRKTVALGAAAVVAVAAVAIVAITNHRDSSPRHDAIAAYITQVDTIEAQMRLQLAKAAGAYRDVSSGTSKPALEPKLVRADRTLRAFERKLVAVPAPPVAARLKALLVELARAEVQVSNEVTALAAFQPRFSAVLREAAAAGRRLSAALAAAAPPKPHTLHGTKKQIAVAQKAFRDATALAASRQADAVDGYNAQLGRVERTLARLHPPALLRPAFATQKRTLAATRRAAANLARTLRGTDRSQVALAGRRLSIAARGALRVSAQQLQVSAVKAYNGRVRRIGAIQARIQAEVARLQKITN
jgi:hypothetical protein